VTTILGALVTMVVLISLGQEYIWDRELVEVLLKVGPNLVPQRRARIQN
jgi:hypothetical protein